MKILHTIGALCFIGCMMSCQSVKNKITEKSGIDSLASNPFITHMYTADPSAHVWEDGRLYIYASHDIDPPRGCDLMDRYSCLFYRGYGTLDRSWRDTEFISGCLGA